MVPEVSQADPYRWNSRDVASLAVADAVKILKGSTAGKLFAAFQALKDLLYGGHLWSPSYYVGTAGNVSAESIRHYIERTEHIKGCR